MTKKSKTAAIYARVSTDKQKGYAAPGTENLRPDRLDYL